MYKYIKLKILVFDVFCKGLIHKQIKLQIEQISHRIYYG